MKNVAIFTILIMTFFDSNAQIGLKWFNLGYKSTRGNQMTTLGGVKGCLYANKKNDNTVTQINFNSVNYCNSDELIYVGPHGVSMVKEGLEKKFNVKLKYSMDEFNRKVWSAELIENVTIELIDSGYGIIVSLTDLKLSGEGTIEKLNSERKEKLKDF